MNPRQWLSAATASFAASLIAFLPGSFDRFVLVKLGLAAVAVGCGAMATRRGELPKSVVVVGSSGLAWFCLAALLAAAPAAALMGRWPRYEGLPVLLLYAGAAWLGARTWHSREGRESWLKALSMAAVALGVLSLTEAIGFSIIGASVESRTGSVLGNATDQGLVGLLLAGLLGGTALRRREPLLLAGTAAAVLTLVLSGSRAALLGAVVVAVVLAIGYADRRLRLLLAGGLVATGALALIISTTRDRLLSAQTLTGRRLLWEESTRLVGDHPVTGVGPNGFADAIGRYHDLTWVARVGVANPPDSPHSWPLQAAAAGGLPLLALALAGVGLIAVTGWRAIREDRDRVVLAAPLAGYAVALLTHFTSPAPTVLAALLAGALIARPASPGPAGSTALTRSAAGFGFAMAGVLIIGALAGVPLQRGVSAAEDGQARAAAQHFEAAQRWRPWDRELARFAAQSLTTAASNGDSSAASPARRWATRAVRQLPDSGESALSLASLDVLANDLESARSRLDSVIDANPTMAAAHVQRALARFGLADPAGALADLDRATRLDPDSQVASRLREQMEQRLQATP